MHFNACCLAFTESGVVEIVISWGITPCRIQPVRKNILPPPSGLVNNLVQVDAEVITRRKMVDCIRQMPVVANLSYSTHVIQNELPRRRRKEVPTKTHKITYHNKLHDNSESNPLGYSKPETLEHYSTHHLRLESVLLIFVFHRALPPSLFSSKTCVIINLVPFFIKQTRSYENDLQ